ncbi:MAG: DUF2853 family protein [Saprospiraceae bacterium]|jgi:hypothetical protein|nr:DUF2853 family protein [Saprospiraceae bacterium]MBP9193912.1 DUF2853 family protein [Saprospiraceae bacterium]
MSQFDEKMSTYMDAINELNLGLDEGLVTAVAKSLGPSIYLADAGTVSSSDEAELATIKDKFLKGKLGISDEAQMDEAIKEVVEQMGSSNRSKHRAIFYALLVKRFGKEELYS